MDDKLFKELEANLKEAVVRIKELEDGSCRYNCRKRKEYCQSFAYYLYKNRQSLRPPTAQVLDDMYDDWKKDQKEWFK